MTVELCAGVWKRRDGVTVKVRRYDQADTMFRWMGSDGFTRRNDGRWQLEGEGSYDLIEYLDEPEPQPDAAEELAALKDDRDRWQTRAVQAEGRVKTLGQELAAVTANRDGLGRRVAETENDRDKWRGRVTEATGRVAELERQVSDLQAQLEAAVHTPDLSADLERVAAERDAAREEVRGLQVRAEQAEGDARQATAKMRHLEGEASKWRAQVTTKNDALLRSDAANAALRSLILDLFERMRCDE